MKITIAGGGNIGTQFMVHCAEKGHDVVAYTSRPELFSTDLNIVDEFGKTTHKGKIRKATSDPNEALSDAELIIVAMPSTMVPKVAVPIFNFGNSKSLICVAPGSGGCECAFAKCIERGNVLFALERVPSVARLVEKGKTVKCTGYRNELHVASIPSKFSEECSLLIESFFDIKCKPIPNFMNITLTPSNPILHTTRLRTIFKDYRPGLVYERLPLFYEEWDDESSNLLILCDEEVQEICRMMPDFNLVYVRSLKDHYESQTVEAMTRKISSIPSFKGLTTPSVEVEGGFIPDLYSRYFTADFSYGLTIIKQVAKFANVETPNIDATMEWYNNISIDHERFKYSDYGILTREDLEKFYLR